MGFVKRKKIYIYIYIISIIFSQQILILSGSLVLVDIGTNFNIKWQLGIG